MLRNLCQIQGTSGDEQQVAEYIKSNITGCDISSDNLGNLIIFKKGKKKPNKKIMVAAHMDEVGFIVTYITDDGFLRFSPVGGVNSKAVIGRQVKTTTGIIGVVGTKAVHHQTSDEKDKAPDFSSLLIDIGATGKEDALKYVKLGERFHFVSSFVHFGSGYVKSKAIDDRAGCSVLMEIISREIEYDTYFVFTVQEEIGTRGAKTATYAIQPDYAIVVEATTACDFPSVPDDKKVCKLGDGAVVSFMDKSTIYNKNLYKLAFDTALGKNIKIQSKTMIAGGNDSGSIHTSAGGVKTIAISIPVRNLHTGNCVMNEEDYKSVKQLVKAMIISIAELG